MSSARILQDDDWVVGAPSERRTSHKPVSGPPPPSSSFSSARLTRAPQKLNGNNSSSNNHNNSNSHTYVKSTCNTTNGNNNSSSNIMNGVIRSNPSSRDTRHEVYGFFSSGQNTHHFESYLTRKGHQDIQPFPQAKLTTERVSVPLPEGTGKAEGVWNAFNGSYTQQDWANYARGQAAPGAKRPTNTASTTATTTARTNGPTSTVVVSHQAQKPSLSPSAMPDSALAPVPASASSAARPSSSSSSSSSSSTSKPSAAPMVPSRPPALLIDLEFTSNTPVTPTLNSSVLADLMDLDFSPPPTSTTTTTTTPNIGTDIGAGPPKDSAEKTTVTEESTLIDFSDAFSGSPALDEPRSHPSSSVTFGDASHSDDHMAADGYTTSNTDYDNEDSDSDSDSSDDDNDHLHRQFGVDKSFHNDKDAESDAKGIFVDFATLANLRTELLDANVTWDDLLTRLKRVRA